MIVIQIRRNRWACVNSCLFVLLIEWHSVMCHYFFDKEECDWFTEMVDWTEKLRSKRYELHNESVCRDTLLAISCLLF